LRAFRIGRYVIPLWLVAVILVSGVCSGAVGYYLWTTLNIPLEVKEPIDILWYPVQLSMYAGERLDFNVTVLNQASINYSVILDFHLSNATYQENYVNFSNEIYTVVPSQQNLTAWVDVDASAPPMNVTLAIDFRRGVGRESQLFFDDFNDGDANGWTASSGTWSVISGENFVTVGIVENGISTVDGLSLTNCIIETQLRFTDSVGYRAGIIFRYTDNEHYYSLEIGNEYDEIDIIKYSPMNPNYGESRAVVAPEYGNSSIIINAETEYNLTIVVQGNTFTAYLDGQQVLSWTEQTYTSGTVGLRARRADVCFDNFNVTGLP